MQFGETTIRPTISLNSTCSNLRDRMPSGLAASMTVIVPLTSVASLIMSVRAIMSIVC